MTLDIHSQSMTTAKIAASSFLAATSYEVRITIPLGKPTSVVWSVPIVDSIADDEAEEQEWDAIVNTPRVRQAIGRLAREARHQIATGETEEGGFAIE